MNEELNYAEMLEIPVETVTVNHHEKKRKTRELSDQVVDRVNDKMETEDPAYAESRTIERTAKKQGSKTARRVLICEFVAVCVLCAAIFLTNLFIADSAINTFVRGLFRGNASTEEADTRTYADFKLSPVVNDYVDAEVTVSSTGVMSFTADCAVYAPAAGEVESITGDAATGYSVRLRHSDTFSTILSGLDDVYPAVGDVVRTNIPLAHTDGEGAVRVMFYEGETLLNCYTVGDAGISWS